MLVKMASSQSGVVNLFHSFPAAIIHYKPDPADCAIIKKDEVSLLLCLFWDLMFDRWLLDLSV